MHSMIEVDVIDIDLSWFSWLWDFMNCYYDYTCDIHFGMDDSLRCYIEMDNESLCGCDVLSYAPLCYFGDFHDYGLWECFGIIWIILNGALG